MQHRLFLRCWHPVDADTCQRPHLGAPLWLHFPLPPPVLLPLLALGAVLGSPAHVLQLPLAVPRASSSRRPRRPHSNMPRLPSAFTTKKASRRQCSRASRSRRYASICASASRVASSASARLSQAAIKWGRERFIPPNVRSWTRRVRVSPSIAAALPQVPWRRTRAHRCAPASMGVAVVTPTALHQSGRP
jgi:hypothetical protein